MVFMIGLIDRQMDFYGVNFQHWCRIFCANRSFVVRIAVTCSFVIIRLNVNGKFAAIGFEILCASFGSEASDFVPSSMASNPNSSFRQDSTKRHVFRLDTIYLNVRPIRARIYFRCNRIRSPFDGVDRHWSLRALCLNNSYRFAIITCQHDMRHSSSWRLAILTALLLASHQSPNPSSIWLLFSNVIPYEVYRQ